MFIVALNKHLQCFLKQAQKIRSRIPVVHKCVRENTKGIEELVVRQINQPFNQRGKTGKPYRKDEELLQIYYLMHIRHFQDTLSERAADAGDILF